jgi:multimeric flavodoxin WrbA
VSMGNMFSHPIKKAMHRCDRMSPKELLGGIAGSIVPSRTRGGGGERGGGGVGGSEGGGSAHNVNEKNNRWRKTVLHSISVKKECRRGDVRRREREERGMTEPLLTGR